MDLFNKEKFKNLEKDLIKHKKELKTLKNKISVLEGSNTELQSSLDNILDALESKTFSKEWKEFQKWKKINDKLPNIEEMYRLKRLRELIELKESTWDNIEEKRLRLLKWQELGDNYKVRALTDYITTTLTMVKNYDTEINSIIENLKKHSKQKDLLEAFKLYAISTEWLKL